MSDQPTNSNLRLDDRQYFTPADLARLLGVSRRTLSRWGARRLGPPKIKIGKLVLYDTSKLGAWLESHEARLAREESERAPRGSRKGAPTSRRLLVH